MADHRSYDRRKMDEARNASDADDPINNRTDYPPEQPRPRCCVGQCTPTRQTLTAANDAMSAASSAAGFVMSLINPALLGYHDWREEEQDRYGAASDRRRAGEAAHQEQQRLISASKAREEERAALLGQLSDTERGIYLTHLEANALQPGSDTLTPMGLGRARSGAVVKR